MIINLNNIIIYIYIIVIVLEYYIYILIYIILNKKFLKNTIKYDNFIYEYKIINISYIYLYI